jgi:hypothetical protein
LFHFFILLSPSIAHFVDNFCSQMTQNELLFSSL